ncbi:type II toxin-antitoxin system RelE family toxin [Streptomyces sp. BH097]|uniref:type II toxin-antitoxin system RelE family toxin n=1 Tax=unclassified Streptomyces TaxID=2593676 RepID=UPI003BB71DEB
MSGQQPYAVRLSPPAAKVLDALPDHTEQLVWDVLDAAAGNPWGFQQWDTSDPEGEDVRIASVGQLSVIYFVNGALGRLSVLDIVWLG